MSLGPEVEVETEVRGAVLLLRDGGSPFAMAAGPISERNQGNWEKRDQDRDREVES